MNVLSVLDLNVKETISLAEQIKFDPKMYFSSLNQKFLVTFYEKDSTRTKISFEKAAKELGSEVIELQNPHFKNNHEDIEDTAKVISEYVDFFAARVHSHKFLEEFAQFSNASVINLLSDKEHPCQAIADLLTIKEFKGLDNVKVAYVGDGNNVCNSLMLGCASLGLDFSVASPKKFLPAKEFLNNASELAELNDCSMDVFQDPFSAVKNADVVYTDVWVSMGQEDDTNKLKQFSEFQVNSELMENAKSNAIFMHCLPAIKDLEVSKDVIDGSHSVVFQQAANRLYAQKAILLCAGTI